MNDMNEMLEFQQIKEMLKAHAMTEKARERLEALKPFLDQTRAEAAVRETTEGRRVLDAFGNPPFSETEGIRKTIQEAQAGILLNPDQLEEIRQFAVMSIRLVRYLQRCRELAPGLAGFAAGLQASMKINVFLPFALFIVIRFKMLSSTTSIPIGCNCLPKSRMS